MDISRGLRPGLKGEGRLRGARGPGRCISPDGELAQAEARYTEFDAYAVIAITCSYELYTQYICAW